MLQCYFNAKGKLARLNGMTLLDCIASVSLGCACLGVLKAGCQLSHCLTFNAAWIPGVPQIMDFWDGSC
jgi:hypothetical protein